MTVHPAVHDPIASSWPDEGGRLALFVRRATADVHTAAEASPVVEDLMAGRLPVVDYARMLAQLHAVYTALEDEVERSADPQLTPFRHPGLARRAAIESDLAHLAGRRWCEKLPYLDATLAYAERIRSAAGEWTGGLLAHHYIRYLGDLSGGQMMKDVLDRSYGLVDGAGTAFYAFPTIDSPANFKAEYRRHLNELAWDRSERRRFVDEVRLAYWHHGEIFAALDG